MQITINGRELCAIQCALREAAATASEAAILATDALERTALDANAQLFSDLARTLEGRAEVARGVGLAYASADACAGVFGGMVTA